jgi:SHS2 domain-containing protein
MKRFEQIEHTADIAIKAYGDSLPEAFAAAGEALFSIITGRSPVAASEKVSFEIESIDREGLLVGFLSELLVQFEVRQMVLTDFEVTLVDREHLRATAQGEPFDEKRHGHGHHVKGVSYHMMEIFEAAGGNGECHVQVLFDI